MMKKNYIKPAITAVRKLGLTTPLCGSQGNWGEAKRNDFNVWEDDEYATEAAADNTTAGESAWVHQSKSLYDE